jgi:hypothetical protein
MDVGVESRDNGVMRWEVLLGIGALVPLGTGCVLHGTKADQFQGQSYYQQQEVIVGGQTIGSEACSGGVRTDDRALALVSRPPRCGNEPPALTYVGDGVYRIETCEEVWRVSCSKGQSAQPYTPPPTFASSPTCITTCLVQDHYTSQTK